MVFRITPSRPPRSGPSHGTEPAVALGYAARVAEHAVTDAETRTERPRRSRRRLSVDERRDELIEAALGLFSTRPPEDVSIDDVAVAAGASRALVYHYFGGKQELYVAALTSAARQLSVLLEPPTEGRPLERLRISLKRYFDFVEDHAAGFTALLRGGPADRSGEVGEIVDNVRRLLLGRILHTVGIEDPGPVLRITLRSWMAAVETAGLDWLEHRDIERAELEHLLVDQWIVMLRAAGRHDPVTGELFDRLSQEEIDPDR
ncbi:TetR/AcrR family transcriptional regulator [Actinomadura miaoliensis]|uniref:TetR/AcrR family transcriptional regulator n=1 Tax=Actinomadura miaoliensis TaxID=430685 RepID=A0ABP7VF18_9ACTN